MICFICMFVFIVFGVFVLLFGLVSVCFICGCLFNFDWVSQGYVIFCGLYLSLCEDYFNQLWLIEGLYCIVVGSVVLFSDEELQCKMINCNILLGVDYSFNCVWGLLVQLFWFSCYYQTWLEGEIMLLFFDGQGIGDVCVLVCYQGFSLDVSLGLQFGVKLFIGMFKQIFNVGMVVGELFDCGLQCGIGIIDVLLGVYKFGYFGELVGYFVQVMVQVVMNVCDGFCLGNLFNVNFGLCYFDVGIVILQLQFNLYGEQCESGVLVDCVNSGVMLVYFSLGLGLKLGCWFDVFVFL